MPETTASRPVEFTNSPSGGLVSRATPSLAVITKTSSTSRLCTSPTPVGNGHPTTPITPKGIPYLNKPESINSESDAGSSTSQNICKSSNGNAEVHKHGDLAYLARFHPGSVNSDSKSSCNGDVKSDGAIINGKPPRHSETRERVKIMDSPASSSSSTSSGIVSDAVPESSASSSRDKPADPKGRQQKKTVRFSCGSQQNGLTPVEDVDDARKRPLSVEEKWRLLFKQADGPPMYRPEEYTFHLRKWFSDNGVQTTESRERERRLPAKDGNDPGNEINSPNVSILLTELLNISELLRSLKFDLKLAHVGFVAEFIREPNNGVFLLLDFLKTTQLGQGLGEENNNVNSARRGLPNATKKMLADEYECLLGLKHATRYQETVRKIMDHPSGLYLISSCIMSSFSKSRIVALELLIKACELGNEGHSQVLKAMSTLRLRFGEPVRFKFLMGMLSSPVSKSLTFQTYCLSFLNKLLETSKSICERVYLQCEIDEAGLDGKQLQKFTEFRDYCDYKAFMEAWRAWKRSYVDVEGLVSVSKRLTADNKNLRNEVEKLKETTKKLEVDKMSLMNIEKELSEQCSELEQKVTTLTKVIEDSQQGSVRSRDKVSDDDTSGENNTAPKTASDQEADATTPSSPSSPASFKQQKSSDLMSISSEDSPPKSNKFSPNGSSPSHHMLSNPDNNDLIVPQIQQRRPKYIWQPENVITNLTNTTTVTVNTNHNVINQNNRHVSETLRIPSAQKELMFHELDNCITNLNNTQNGLGTNKTYRKEYDDFTLNWSYPAVPLPIAVVTSGKSSLTDMAPMSLPAGPSANGTLSHNSVNDRPATVGLPPNSNHLMQNQTKSVDSRDFKNGLVATKRNGSAENGYSMDFHKALFQKTYPVPGTDTHRVSRTFHI